MRVAGRVVLRALGWRLVGGFADVPRFVLVGAPHTSNWDGVVGLAAAAAADVEFNLFAKRPLFVGPLGTLLRAFGGVPVDQGVPGGLVGRAVQALDEGQARVVVLTPEGTRGRVDAWRTGFHRIAVEARVPVAVGVIDWGRREVGVVGTVVPSGDLDADLGAIGALYAGVQGRRPDRQTLPPPGRPALESGPSA